MYFISIAIRTVHVQTDMNRVNYQYSKVCLYLHGYRWENITWNILSNYVHWMDPISIDGDNTDVNFNQ